MDNKRQALYEKMFLRELEEIFLYSNILGNGKARINNVDLSDISAEEIETAKIECRNWVNAKILYRFNKAIFREPVDISIKLDKETMTNYFQVEGETYKLIMRLDTKLGQFSMFLRSLLKD
jgi:hypothetical protein